MGDWQPILDGELADRARTTVLDIARAIAAGDGLEPKATDRTLFWGYIAGAFDDAWIAEQYDVAVGKLVDLAGRDFDNLTLYYGAAGVGFTIAHVSETGTADASLEAIDTLIAASLREFQMPEYDLITGLVGVAVYLFERGDAPSARTALDQVIRQLVARAERSGDGMTWFTPPALLPPAELERFPEGSLNCGVAHGMPGVLAVLGRAAGLPGMDPAVRTLAIDGLRWLLGRRGPLTERGRYPAWIGRDLKPQHATRTAWCYGDPGIALTTYSLTSRLGLPTDDALELGREVARRAPEHAAIADAGLCHGTAGLAHICNRLFQASGDELFRSAAREWYARTLALRGAHGPGVGGYMMLHSVPGTDPVWSPAVMILDGAMGVALSLLSAIEPTAPNWDRLMLCEP